MRTKYTSIMALIILSNIACSKKINKSASSRNFEYSEYRNMWVEKREYSENDTIIIYFSKIHPAEIGIKSPDMDFFYLVYNPAIPSIKDGKPVISYNEFKKTESIQIIPASFKANPHDLRYTKNIRVFEKPGDYTFFLGDNLSTDDGTPVEKLILRYSGKKNRP